MKRRLMVVLVVVLTAAIVSVAAAGAATRHRPVIGQAYGSRSTLPAAGASVRVSVRVRYATRCKIYADRTAGGPMRILRVVSCKRGHAKFILPAVVNQASTAIRVHFRVVASGKRGRAQRTWYLPEAGVESPPPPPPGPVPMLNWAGYVGTAGGPVTDAVGTFTVPTLNCTDTPNAAESTWDGIGGFNPGEALIQTGVQSECVNGVQTDMPWWEIVGGPTSLPEMDFSGLPVQAGDIMTVDVGQDSQTGAWVTCIADARTGGVGLMETGLSAGIAQGTCSTFSNYTAQQDASTYSYPGGTTAEWIAEDPGDLNGNEVPFANFGTVTFSGIGMSTSGSAVATEIVQGGQILATPGPLSNNGFTVTYTGP